MIYIEKDKTNKITLTLSEKSKKINPFYLFVFTPEYGENLESVFFTGPDISIYTNRINIFELVEGENGSEQSANGFDVLPTGGSHLKLKQGQYIYTIYESDIETLLISETTGNVVEKGRLIVGLDIDNTTELDINNEDIYL